MMPDDRKPAGVRVPFDAPQRERPPAPSAPAPYWQIACRSRDLRRSPRAVTIGDRPLVLFRDAQGDAVALEDRCAHRNAPLSIGRVCKGRLQCRYHGWEYDSEGRAAHIPALPDGGSARGRAACRQALYARAGRLCLGRVRWRAAGRRALSVPALRRTGLDELRDADALSRAPSRRASRTSSIARTRRSSIGTGSARRPGSPCGRRCVRRTTARSPSSSRSRARRVPSGGCSRRAAGRCSIRTASSRRRRAASTIAFRAGSTTSSRRRAPTCVTARSTCSR